MAAFKNTLNIGASWFGPSMTAREVLNCLKGFLKGLEAVSPWSRPFDVSGTETYLSYMKIEEDWSNFDTVVLRAMNDKNKKFVKPVDDGDDSISMESISMAGFSACFSDAIQREDDSERVDISFLLGESESFKGSGITMLVRDFESGQVNSRWSESVIVQNVFDYFIDFFNPTTCHVCTADNMFDVLDRSIDIYRLNWMSYTTHSQVRDALSDFPQVSSYKNGVLIKLGDDVSVVSDPSVHPTIRAMRDRLREVGATNWYKKPW